jgi:hypothetical protein
VGKCFSKQKNQGCLFSGKPYFFQKTLAPSTRGISPETLNLIYLMKNEKGNYKVNKVGLWGLLPGY